MGKIIKAIWERCKSKFIDWFLDSLRDYFNLSQLVFIMPVLAWIQGIPSFYWFPILVFTCALFPYAIKGFVFLSNYFDKPVLEIIYDNGRYNEIVKILDDYGHYDRCLAYRFAVYNNCHTEIKNITVLMEQNTLSDLPRYINCTDSQNKKQTQDFPPNCIRIYDIYYMTEALADRLKGISVQITVKGEKIKTIIKTITL